MKENPYSAILKMVRRQAENQIPVTFRFGVIRCANPLAISVSGTEQSKTDLLMNAAIGELKIGDNVLLIPINGDQQFIVLCKVVSV